MKSKFDAEPGDIIHIYNMIGEPNYQDREGTIYNIDSIGQLHGSWGGLALTYDDDWEILELDKPQNIEEPEEPEEPEELNELEEN